MRALAILASCHFCSQSGTNSRMPKSSRVVQIPVGCADHVDKSDRCNHWPWVWPRSRPTDKRCREKELFFEAPSMLMVPISLFLSSR